MLGKHGLLSLTPFTGPIASVLRTLDDGVDQLTFVVLGSVETCADDVTQNKDSLDSTLMEAIDTYGN